MDSKAIVAIIIVAIVVGAAAYFAGLSAGGTKTVTQTVTSTIAGKATTYTTTKTVTKTVAGASGSPKTVTKTVTVTQAATVTLTQTVTVPASVKEAEMKPVQINLRQEIAKLKNVSPRTRACLNCHVIYTPGIVADWLRSKHAHITPAEAWKKPPLEREISSLPRGNKKNYIVGCFECHGARPGSHPDTFNHFGFKIHTIVTPRDCAECHAVEVRQYERSVKAWAHYNLVKNPVYMMLVNTSTQIDMFGIKAGFQRAVESACFACHGTKVVFKGLKTYTYHVGNVSIQVKLPVYEGWPNHGVGRVNPDGSRGACTACHPRHSFSIAIARSPYTCAQCHLDPDVPAFNVWKESKHGNIFLAEWKTYNMTAVPWVPGRDFRAPTCAVCHFSLLVTPDGRIIVNRTHDPGDRIWIRLFGVYAHPHPKPEYEATFKIRNKAGLPLPYCLLTGEPAKGYVIDEKEMAKRREQMIRICASCHSVAYAEQRIKWFEEVVNETNKAILVSTRLLAEAWKIGMAKGLKIEMVNGKPKITVEGNPFDEYIERLWVETWLFYANSIRYGAAMNGPDWATFKRGWYKLTKTIHEMEELIKWYNMTKQAYEASVGK